jgi:hypothetical protein
MYFYRNFRVGDFRHYISVKVECRKFKKTKEEFK